MRKQRARIAGGAPHHLAIAAADDDIGEIGRQRRPLRHRQQMALALDAGDFDQRLLVDDGRSAQQRTRDRDLVLARELSDQAARRVGEQRQPFGQIGARGEFGMRNEAGQNAVEQLDMIGPEIRRPLQEQFGDPPRGVGAALGIAISDDLIKPGDQRCRRQSSKHTQNPPHWRVFRHVRSGFVKEGLGLKRAGKAVKSRLRGLAGLAVSAGKPLYQPQLMVLIRSRIESGPLPDPLFFIT